MNKNNKKIISTICLVLSVIVCFVMPIEVNASQDITKQQQDAINMINYLSVLTQEINDSSNSQIFLDNAFSEIENNLSLNSIDVDSQDYINEIFETISTYQAIGFQRNQVQYLYEQNQAGAIQSIIPAPLDILNIVQSGNLFKSMASVLYLAIDAKSSYDSYICSAEKEYIQEIWELNYESKTTLDDSRRNAFYYLIRMCAENGLDDEDVLRAKEIQQFSKLKNEQNVTRRIENLKDNEITFSRYGEYWILLAESYYEKGQYKNCIEAINRYEELSDTTLRYNHSYANALALGITAAQETYKGDLLEKYIVDNCTKILSNIDETDWQLRYFVANSYLYLYNQTSNSDYLSKGYIEARKNVKQLVTKQEDLNGQYLEDIKTVSLTKYEKENKLKKKEADAYNKMLEKRRKVELPPVYKPLLLNLDLMFSISDKLLLSNSDKKTNDEILHSNGQKLFYIDTLDSKYWYNKDTTEYDCNIFIDNKSLLLPASILYEDSVITMEINSKGEKTIIDDWKIKEVERKKTNNVEDFSAKYSSDMFSGKSLEDGDIITIEVSFPEGVCGKNISVGYEVKKTKKLKVINDINYEKIE